MGGVVGVDMGKAGLGGGSAQGGPQIVQAGFVGRLAAQMQGEIIKADVFDQIRRFAVDQNAVFTFAEDIAEASGLYMTEPTEKATSYGGGFENWFRHTYTKPGLCIELVDNENKINPCTNENYSDFERIVNYEKTRFIFGAALSSDNK